jgi:2-haloacid dehalogenase
MQKSLPIKAVLFDAYGTLFDVYSVGLLAEQLFPGQGQTLAQMWRDKQIEYTRLCSMSQQYQPFWSLTRSSLRYVAQRLKLDLHNEREELLMNQYRHLSAFPENHEVLQALQDRGIRTGILSNGDPDMLDVAVKSAGLTLLLDEVISVDPLRKFKTDPACYALGCERMQLPAAQILFVSCNGWDALGATWFGYTTLWVNRYQLPHETLEPQPTRTGHNLREVLSFFH